MILAPFPCIFLTLNAEYIILPPILAQEESSEAILLMRSGNGVLHDLLRVNIWFTILGTETPGNSSITLWEMKVNYHSNFRKKCKELSSIP